MFGHERYRVRVCIESLHPSNDYSFHAMRKLQPIEARRGEERRGSTTKGEQQQWSVVSTSIMDLEEKFRWPEGEIRSKSWLRSNSSSNRTCFVFHLYFIFGECECFIRWRIFDLTIKEDRMANSLMDCGRGITWSVNKFQRSNISLEELYNTISSDQISTTFILIFLVRTRESG